MEIAGDVHGHLASKQRGIGRAFCAFLQNLQSASDRTAKRAIFIRFISEFSLFQNARLQQKVWGEGDKDDLLRKFLRQRGKFFDELQMFQACKSVTIHSFQN